MSPGAKKQNGSSTFISSHQRAKKGIQTAKVWPKKTNKATSLRKSRWKIELGQHFTESRIKLAKLLDKYETDHGTKAYLLISIFYSLNSVNFVHFPNHGGMEALRLLFRLHSHTAHWIEVPVYWLPLKNIMVYAHIVYSSKNWYYVRSNATCYLVSSIAPFK